MSSGRNLLSHWAAGARAAASGGIKRPSDRAVERAVRYLTLGAAAIANLLGTAAVFVLSVWVLPTSDIEGDSAPIIVNLAAAGAYLLIALPLGTFWALRRLRPGRQWLKDGREPTAAEQRNLLRAPLQVAFVVGTLWMVAALSFGAYNLTYSFELGQRVAITVALGGLVTCAAGYLLSERLLRPAAARALAARRLEEPALPGVTVRSIFAWAMGSGIPMLGLLLIGFSALTEGDFSRDQLAIAVLALCGGALLLGFGAAVLAARVTAAPIVSVRQAIGEIERGDLDTEVPVYDGTEVGLLQSGVNRMVEGLRERARIRELFGMHVGEEVARTAMERGAELGGETREVGVLFVDMVGSTAIATERSPDEVVRLLNEFFGLVVEVVDEHGGWVNKFEGDAALAVFGAPGDLEQPAAKALAAGRELADRLRGGIADAEAGIGVAYGEVVAGNIGSDERLEYTVIGDAVNVAARLTELAKDRPGRLLASGAALEAAGEGERSRWSLRGSEELRGRAEPVEVAVPVEATSAASGEASEH